MVIRKLLAFSAGLGLSIVGLFAAAPAVNAGLPFKVPDIGGTGIGGDYCIGFGCGDEYEAIIGEGVRGHYESIGLSLQSASDLCQKVGVDVCSDTNFIWTYQTLRLGQYSDWYDDQTSCQATGYNIQELGMVGAQIASLYYGTAIPPEMWDYAGGVTERYITTSCKVLFPNSPGTQKLVVYETRNGDDAYAASDEGQGMKEAAQRI